MDALQLEQSSLLVGGETGGHLIATISGVPAGDLGYIAGRSSDQPLRLEEARSAVRKFAWTDIRPDHDTYVRVVLDSIGQRQRWRAQYEAAKAVAAAAAGVSTVAQPP